MNRDILLHSTNPITVYPSVFQLPQTLQSSGFDYEKQVELKHCYAGDPAIPVPFSYGP